VDERKRRRFAVARLVATLALVGVVVWRVDARAVLARLGSLDARWILAFVALSLPLYLLCAWRWCFTAARVGAPLRFRRAWLDYYVSTLLNQVLPLGMAGDVVRAARHKSRLGDEAWGPAARAVLLERFSGVVALLLFAVASTLVWLWRGRGAFAGATTIVLGGVVLGALVLARVARRPALARLLGDGRAALLEHGALGFQLSVSLASVAILLAMFTCAGRAAAVPLDLPTALQVVPLVLLSTTVPWAFAGWGVRELSTAALYRLMGLDAAAGVAVSIAFGLLSLLAAAPGLLVLAIPERAHADEAR